MPRKRRTIAAALAAGALVSAALPAASGMAQPAPALPSPAQLPAITPLARPAYDGELPLYPGRKFNGADEQWETYLGGPIVRNVVTPTLIPLRPAPGTANGTA